jgi:cytochrome c oxidase subunit II
MNATIHAVVVAILGLALHASLTEVSAQPGPGLVDRGRQLFTEQGCHGCHTIGKMGTPIATDLSRIGARYGRPQIEAWLRDPSKQRPTAHMPTIRLTAAEVTALAAYLGALR